MIDHLVYTVPDLAAGVARFAQRTGITPVKGGGHVGLGTANYLVGLGGSKYLELIGPDPDQPEPGRPRPFGLDGRHGERLLTWALRVDDLDQAVAAARAAGYDPGEPGAMSRRRADGVLLAWRLTPGAATPEGGLVPFLIEWGDTPHPTSAGLPTIELASLTAEHPHPDRVLGPLAALGADLPVRAGARPALRATLTGGLRLE